MKGPKRIPITAAAGIGKKYKQNQVILVTFDKDTNTTHTVTWGATKAECGEAALGGEFVREALGWPDDNASLSAIEFGIAFAKFCSEEGLTRDQGLSRWVPSSPQQKRYLDTIKAGMVKS